MIKTEFKKCLIKHYGALIAVIVIIGELVLVNTLYQPQKFSSDISERNYYEYMSSYSGQLTHEKEVDILAEQERIVDAKNIRDKIEIDLLRGKYSSENEYISEYKNAVSIIEKKDAFDVLFDKYSYSLDNPRSRFLTIGNYNGLAQDAPDVFLFFAVIFLTAALFLGEEQSNVITFIRISPEGGRKTLWGKLTAIFAFVFVCHLFRTFTELFAMISSGSFAELSYPVQSIEFFADCPYDISILQTFVAVSALRLLGYFFVEALVIFLAVTVRKSLPTVFVPCAACVLQQFAFDPATPAYCISTGFLRGVGYFRGTVAQTDLMGNDVTIFSEIPLSYLVFLIAVTAIFITVSIAAAYSYYSCKPIKLRAKTSALLAMFILSNMLSGCSADTNTHTRSVVFNLSENSFFAQNDADYFVSIEAGIMRVSKSDGTKIYLPRNEFDMNKRKKLIALCGNVIYCNDFLDGIDITAFSLNDLGGFDVGGLSGKKSKGGFLGLKTQLNKDLLSLDLVTGIFTNGDAVFAVCDTSVYQIDNDKPRRIINSDVYDGMLCFDGKNIYYINGLLRLNCYDVSSGETMELGGELAQSVYYDGTRVLFSDKNGIFSLDTIDFSILKLSDKTAEKISSDGKNIVYSSDGALYLLSNDEVKLSENAPVLYAVISDLNKVLIFGEEGDDFLELIEIPLNYITH